MCDRKKPVVKLGVGLALILILFSPNWILADDDSDPTSSVTSYLSYLVFSENQSSTEYTLIVGGTSSIEFRLYNNLGELYSGSVTAYISDSTGKRTFYSVSGSQGNYSINNVIIDQAGKYSLTIRDSKGYPVGGTILAKDAAVEIKEGSLVLNTDTTVTALLTDSDGNPLIRKSVTVDGSEVGANSSVYTTLYDGTFKFSLTPSQLGTVKFTYGGHVIGTMDVKNVVLAYAGILKVNLSSTVDVRLTDPDGNPLALKSLTVDGSGVGTNSSSYTTSKDGSFKFTMTPAETGSVKFIYNGYMVGTMDVMTSYAVQERVGNDTTNNSELSVEISRKGWGSTRTVILTRDDLFTDAMVSVPLSKQFGAPILMTPSDQLDQGVLQEIHRLGADTVYIIGGTGAVSQAVENQLWADQLSVVRYGGVDASDTAAQIADVVGPSGTVYLAYESGVSDAIAVSAIAAQNATPILLTATNHLSEATVTALKALAPSEIVIIGGTAVISSEVENQLKENYIVKRWGGVDQYATQQIIFQNLLKQQSPIYFASDQLTPVNGEKPKGDALLTSALAARNNGFVVTLPADNLPSALNYFLLFNKGYLSSATVIGNGKAISYGLEQQLMNLVAH